MGKHALCAQRSDEFPYHFRFFGHQPSALWEAYAETTLSGRGELCLMGRETNTRMMLFDGFLRGIPVANPCKIHVQTMSKAILQIWRDLAKSSGWRVELQLESNFTMDSTPLKNEALTYRYTQYFIEISYRGPGHPNGHGPGQVSNSLAFYNDLVLNTGSSI